VYRALQRLDRPRPKRHGRPANATPLASSDCVRVGGRGAAIWTRSHWSLWRKAGSIWPGPAS